MNLVKLDHPDAERLSAYALGKLDESSAALIHAHLEECGDCRQTVEDAADDTLTSLVRASATPLDLLSIGEEAALSGGQTGDATPSVAARQLDVPAELSDHPRYLVRELLGRGGMGAVYRAEHRLMERTVALKVINRELTDRPAVVERFRREVKTAARLDHPNIVRAHDAEQAGDTHFLVMEYVAGTNLAQLVREQGPLPVAQACDYVRQAALGLQHAFEHGMVHRDIKPHNLMVTPDGRVKILDFGLARLASELAPTDAVTDSGVVLGTADYIAPEQADDPHVADTRADIYSLGCTLYFLLTGQPPFPEGTLMQKLMAHSKRSFQPVTDFRNDVRPDLVRILDRMTAKFPGERYQTPAEIARALAPFARGEAVADTNSETVLVPAASGPPPGPRTWTHRPRLVWPLLVAALLLGGVLLGVMVFRIATDKGELVIQTESDDDVEVIVSQGGKVVKIIDTKTKEQITLDSGDYELALKDQPDGLKLSLYKFALKRGEQVLATVERVPRAEPVGEVRRFEGHAGPVRAVAISRDGRYVLSGSGFPEGDKTLRLWRAATGKEIRRFKGHTGQVLSVAFSSNGRRALSGSQDRTLRLWDVPSGKEIRRLHGHKGDVFSLTFSPDGRYALSGSSDRTVRLWDVDSGDEVRKFEGHEDWVLAVAFSPDGRRAVSAGNDGTVRLWEMETGKQLRTYQGTPRGISWSVAWSPNGRQVVFGDGAKLVLWDAETGKVVRAFGGGAMCVAFSPDGRRVLSGGTDKVLRLWDVETGTELHHFAGHLDAIWTVAFSADGRYALSGSGGLFRDGQWRPGRDWTIRLWRLPDRAPLEKADAVGHP